MKKAEIVQILALIAIALFFIHIQSDDVISHYTGKTALPSVVHSQPTTTKPTTNASLTSKVPSSTNVSSSPVVLEASDYIYQKYFWDRAPIVVEDYKLVFFTIPKVGCTVFKQLFRRMAGAPDWRDTWKTPGRRRQNPPHNPRYNGLRYLFHYSRMRANEILQSPEYTRAIFVRDPKERLLSAYMDKAVNTPYVANNCCSGPEKEACKKSMQNLTFDDFLDRILGTCENEHWNPQDARIDRNFWKTINFVGHMDTVQQDARRLLERIGAWDEYGKSGWGEYGNQSIFERGLRTPHATEAGSLLESYYSVEAERKVEDFYRDDYNNPALNLTLRKIFP